MTGRHNETQEQIEVAPVMKIFQDALFFCISFISSKNIHYQHNLEIKLGT